MRESVAVLVGMDKTEKSRLKKARVSISRHRTVPLAIGMEQCFWPIRLSRKRFLSQPLLPAKALQSFLAHEQPVQLANTLLQPVTHRRAQRNISDTQHFGQQSLIAVPSATFHRRAQRNMSDATFRCVLRRKSKRST